MCFYFILFYGEWGLFLFRSKRPVFSASEAEELVEVAVFLSSDHQLEGLLVLLDEFVQSVINYFTDEEWNISCEKIAKSISCRYLPFSNFLDHYWIFLKMASLNWCSSKFHWRTCSAYHFPLCLFPNLVLRFLWPFPLLTGNCYIAFSIGLSGSSCPIFKLALLHKFH